MDRCKQTLLFFGGTVLCTVSLILLSTCAAVTMIGTWSGTYEVTSPVTDSGSMIVIVDSDDNGSISGTINSDGDIIDFTGSRTGSNYTFVGTSGSFTITVSGKLDGNTSTGTWSDSDGKVGTYTLTKQ